MTHMRMHRPSRSWSPDPFDPSQALRSGDADARLVLLLWCLRKSFYPLLWLGLSIAVIAFDDVNALNRRFASLSNPSEVVASLLSPMAGVVFAFGVRIVVGVLALVSAYPLTKATTRADYTAVSRTGGFFRLWWDRLYMARAYRSLRWTWAVRQFAAERLGRWGRIALRCSSWIRWSGVVLAGIFLIIIGSSGV